MTEIVSKQAAYRKRWAQKKSEEQKAKRKEALKRWREKNPSKYRESYTDQNAKRKEARKKYMSRPEVRERRRELQRQKRAKNPEAYKRETRNTHLKKKFGMTIEEVDHMFLAQGSKCAACGESDLRIAAKFCVDHCHERQKVRGILCYRCNVALGLVKDSKQTLLGLVAYLSNSETQS